MVSSESKLATDIDRTVGVRPYRFSLFQVVSAYTNTGLSLVDQSMVPFQTAYPMIFFMIFLVVIGNTGFVSSFLLSGSTK